MSYQVLARKWRPKNFNELVGQQQTARALMNALDNQRLHHAYLFTGTRGVGKTTIARILSKSLNCETGITSNPCGECSSCLEISQGNFVDLLEIDAASKTKVEDTRELLDNVQYRPTRGRYKVYLIDEVHMLSGHSFNALLKTLEEPPPHVIFLLATTDPQKLPVTVLSRCLQFHLRRMEIQEIITHLAFILQAENIEFEQGALEAIAKGADGSMRDALSLLDQAIAYCDGKIEQTIVLDMLGSIDRDYSFQLFDAISSNDATQLMQVIQHIAQFSPDFDELLADWLSLLHQVAVCQATGIDEDQRVSQLASTTTAADLQLYYQLSMHARRDLAYAPHPRQGFEMAMLRILAFKPQTAPIDNKTNKKLPTQNIDANSALPESTRVDQKKTSENLNIKPNATSSAPARSEITQLQTAKKIEVESDAEFARYEDHVVLSQTSEISNTNEFARSDLQSAAIAKVENDAKIARLTLVKNEPLRQETIIAEPSKAEQVTQAVLADTPAISVQQEPLSKLTLAETNPQNWYQAVEGLTITGHALQVLLNSTAEFIKDTLEIRTLLKMESLLTANAKQSIESALCEYYDSVRLSIRFEFVENTSETPRERQNRLYQIQLNETYETLLNDPQVNKLMEHLSASLPKESIVLKNR